VPTRLSLPPRPLRHARLSTILCAALIGAAGSTFSAAMAQDNAATGANTAQPDTKQARAVYVDLLDNWIHYTKIHQVDLAKEFATALLDANLTNGDFASLINDWAKREGDFTAAILRAQKDPELEALAGRLNAKYEAGILESARNASEISRNIGLLTKSIRERDFGRRGLLKAGEYATPQLLQALMDKSDPIRQAEVRQVLVDMNRQAIIPLCTALGGLDQSSQQVVVTMLGDAPGQYTTALPFLYELRESTQSDELRSACDRAIQRIGGEGEGRTVSQRFLELANQYYIEMRSLTSFPNEPFQLLWSFDPGVGLIPTPVATEVYHEAMAMKMSERSLKHDTGNGDALSMWLAANFSREIDTPQGYENPAYPSTRRDANYFAVASGATATERVLGRALDDRDTPLARRAISAIEQTAGSSGLWTGEGSRQPLLEALRYPNRRVQYEAALALGAAQPREAFTGPDRVVPVLASAIRSASARYALIVADRPEDQPPLIQALKAQGFTVLPPARRLSDVEQEIAEAPGVDLVVSVLPAPLAEELIREVHGRAALSATPVLAMVEAPGYFELDTKFAGDRSVKIIRGGAGANDAVNAAEQLLVGAVGEPVNDEEAKGYKARSLGVLRDLAVSGNTVLNVTDASNPLIAALGDSSGPTRTAVAEVLSHIPTKQVQVALADMALSETGAEQVALLRHLADSAKRFGNLLEPRQVSTIVSLAMGDGGPEEATAAAALMGALKLPNAEIIPLILEGKK